MPGDSASLSLLRRRLLSWYDAHARDLPWRRSADPYSIWISEVMLQQTRVDAVLGHYERFLARFPTIADLARAECDDVVAAWAGLGYYRRARFLHAGARYVAAEYGGTLPRERRLLERIPGIGTYTAGAIASIAFGQREAAVDGNAARVIVRLFAGGTPGAAAAPPAGEVADLAASLARFARPGDFNQALMDLGSAVCVPRDPDCGRCPLAEPCRARALGVQRELPVPRTRKAPQRVHLACAVVRHGRRALLLRRRVDDPLLPGMWELPTVENGDGIRVAMRLGRLIRTASGLRVRVVGPRMSVRHEIVGRRITADVYLADVDERGVEEGESASTRRRHGSGFFSEAEMSRAALSALPVKILRAAGFLAHQPRREARAATRT